MTDKALNRISKNFRKWLLTEATKTGAEAENETGGDAGDVRRQTQYRDRQANNADWKNVAFFGPPSAVQHAKDSWEAYKRIHQDLWNEPERGSETAPTTDNDKADQ